MRCFLICSGHKPLSKVWILAAFIVSACAAPQPRSETEAAPPNRPNIIVLYADDLGYGDIGAYNEHSKIPTPHIDKLAAEGIRFVDAHSSSGICTPSRFALLTGQYHWRRTHEIVGSFGPSVFKTGEFTIAKMLQENGYRTAVIGKWHLGWDWEAIKVEGDHSIETTLPWGKPYTLYMPEAFDWSKPIPGGPLDHGFDYYYGDGTINFPPYAFIENDRVLTPPTAMMNETVFPERAEGDWEFRPGPMDESWNPMNVLPTITEKAVDWISQQNAEQPFFLYFSFPSPHAPIVPNESFVGTSQAGPYGDFVVETDAMVGQLMTALENAGFKENTLVIFSSDNGPEKFAYERQRRFDHWSSGKFRGLKRDVFEGGHRIPLIMSWPKQITPNSVAPHTFSQVDLAATIAGILNHKLDYEEAIDSVDYSELLRGHSPNEKQFRTVTIQNTFEGVYALRQGDWLYINAADGVHTAVPDWYVAEMDYSIETTGGLLYNLADDPGQTNNLYLQYPQRVEDMHRLLAFYLEGNPSAPHAH